MTKTKKNYLIRYTRNKYTLRWHYVIEFSDGIKTKGKAFTLNKAHKQAVLIAENYIAFFK